MLLHSMEHARYGLINPDVHYKSFTRMKNSPKGIHRTLNVNYTYYENIDLFKEVVEYYEPFKDDRFLKFTVIDDGSSKNPLTRDDVPHWWDLYRVKTDLGWGNEICRNLLMRLTKYEWNALIDLDYVIKLREQQVYNAATRNFFKYYGHLSDLKIGFQFAKGRRVKYDDFTQQVDDPQGYMISINSFVISRTCFLSTKGYDQAYGYTYGYDYTLFEQLDKETIIPDTEVIKIANQACVEGNRYAPGDKEAFKEFVKLQNQYIKEGVYSLEKGWINETERLKRCVTLPEYEIL
jgi:hypothetical protein